MSKPHGKLATCVSPLSNMRDFLLAKTTETGSHSSARAFADYSRLCNLT